MDVEAKENTGIFFMLGRKCIQYLCNLVNSFTIETSFGLYVNSEKKIVRFDKKGFE